jgi:hypothetical protein
MVQNTNSSLVYGDTPEILNRISESNKSIAIVQRDIDFLKKELMQLIQHKIRFKHRGTIEEIFDQLNKQAIKHNWQCPRVCEDIISILHIFSKLQSSTIYSLTFERVESDMCKRFHTDIHDLRLLCTYFGRGTLWISEENVNRSALYSHSTNDEIVINQDDIQEISVGHIAILKGEEYPQSKSMALVHRSPEIENTQEIRLLLRIDTEKFMGAI